MDTLYGALEAKPVPHMSVLEFGWVCLLVEGVSVKTRIQLLRSRLFSTMERSTRALDMSDAECIIPETAKHEQGFWMDANSAMINYKASLAVGETFEDASYSLPVSIETSFFQAGNLRIWYEYFQKRLCKKHVQREHYRMAMEMFSAICCVFPIMASAHPCKKCGKCKI